MKRRFSFVLACLTCILLCSSCADERPLPAESDAATLSPTVFETAGEEYIPYGDFRLRELPGETYSISYHGSDAHVTVPAEINGWPVIDIDQYGFSASYKTLVSVTLPEGLLSIGRGAFQDCAHLQEINLPASLTSIGHQAFLSCTSLKSVTFGGEALTHPSSAIFQSSGLESVTIREGTTEVPNQTFMNTELTHITLPSTVKILGQSVFPLSDQLAHIELNEGLEVIGDHAFDSLDALTEIVIPSTVTSIDESAFRNCPRLEKVIFLGDAPANYEHPIADFDDDGSYPDYTIYYAKDAEGFTTPEWCGYACYPLES